MQAVGRCVETDVKGHALPAQQFPNALGIGCLGNKPTRLQSVKYVHRFLRGFQAPAWRISRALASPSLNSRYIKGITSPGDYQIWLECMDGCKYTDTVKVVSCEEQ